MEEPAKVLKHKRRTRIAGLPAEEYKYKYFIENKEHLYQQRKNKKWLCEACNKEYSYHCKYLHKLTKKHLTNEELFNLKSNNLNG